MTDRRNEAERLRRLIRFDILDTAPDARFDRIAGIASRVFQVPMAGVSLIDADRQWFKAGCGFPFAETDRGIAFCDHTIRSDAVFVVSNAAEDTRFRDNPLVAGSPFIRFYAGAPLASGMGLGLGALCIMDTRPRDFTTADAEILRLLAEEAGDQLKHHRLAGRLKGLVDRRREQSRLLLIQRQELARKEKLFQQVSRLAKIGGWTLDLESAAMTWTDEIYQILEIDDGYALDLRSAVDLVFEVDRQRLIDMVRVTAATGELAEIEVSLTTGRGNSRWLRILAERDTGSGRLFGTAQDVTARRATEAELNRLATTDALTGLANRYVFRRSVDEALALMQPRETAALLLLDLDEFKDINDTLGHDAGDRLLEVLAQRLRSNLHRSDLIGRLGGDEFAVLLRRARARSAGAVAGTARAMLEAATAPVSYRGHSLRVGASIGIAAFPKDAADAETLLKSADIALYSAKHAGGDRYCFFSPQLGQSVENRHMMFQEIRQGLETGQFTVAYQPVIDLRSGAVAGFEALIRWQHPIRGLLPAGNFIEALEEPALGRVLSQASMEIALAQYAAWKRAGEPVGNLGINVSIGQLRDLSFAENFLERVVTAGLEPRWISVEITEGVFLGRGAESVVRRIRALHDAGMRIVLDDFGTGYASLTHLRQFPVQILKIDASFVRTLLDGTANRTIVKTVIDMAHGLGMRAVAEGVEGPETDALLRLMGCDLGQGYYYGRPTLGPAVPDFLRAWDSEPARERQAG